MLFGFGTIRECHGGLCHSRRCSAASQPCLVSLLVPAVVSRTERLPVRPTPEQRLIPSVGGDVVNHGGHCDNALSCAHHAQRVLSKELLSRLLPLVAVPALGACHAFGAPASSLHCGHALGIQHLHPRLEHLQLVCHIQIFLKSFAGHQTRPCNDQQD